MPNGGGGVDKEGGQALSYCCWQPALGTHCTHAGGEGGAWEQGLHSGPTAYIRFMLGIT